MDQALTVFLDRDGVICEFHRNDYTRRPEDFRFLPGAREALRLLNEAGATVVVVSNQAGVNRGLFSADDLAGIDRLMRAETAASGGLIRASYYCPHTPEDGCDCRKPGTGLFKRAARELSLDLAAGRAWMVGDSEVDVIPARALGLVSILVLSGSTVFARETAGWAAQPDHVAKDLLGALDYIL